MKPEGPGPFPAVVILHGCGGPTRAGRDWSALFREAGYLTAITDQFGPHGVAQICTDPDPRVGSGVRLRDTHSLVRLLQQRADVIADRIFLIGSSAGHYISATAMTDHWDLLDPPGGVPAPRPRGAISLYGSCGGLPPVTHGPILMILAADDDWAPPRDCIGWLENGWRRGVRPRTVLIPDAHHGFDNPSDSGRTFSPGRFNPFSPTMRGATTGYSAAATAVAHREVLAFLASLR